MHHIKVFVVCISIIISSGIYGQEMSFDEVNTKSYILYTKGNWKELLTYGNSAFENGQDFLLLRLRMGYAAFMLNNFSEAAKHYEKVIDEDSYNSTARYYAWMSRRFLNQQELADVHVKYIAEDLLVKEKFKSFAITGAGNETSFKFTDIDSRGNTLYSRVDLSIRLRGNINMTHSVALYNQTIREPKLTSVFRNNNIVIDQKEYYNKTLINLSKNLQMKGVYHFISTPFNNLTFNNHIGSIGINYFDYYFHLQADASFAKLTDSSFQQYNFQLGLYPLGNLNLYSFSTGMMRVKNEGRFNFKQVVGFKLMKNTWVELNGTFGEFTNLLENDALYVYNAIDKNLFKGGGTLYLTPFSKWIIQVGYTYEKRQLYNTLFQFHQYSITGGLSWKF